MNITLSVAKKIVIEARKVAASMGTILNQIIRKDLERLTRKQNIASATRPQRRTA